LILEACVETAAQAVLAEQNGADRIELCSHLEWDGLSPSDNLLNETLSWISIPIMAMVRSRKGDFFYSSEDINDMKVSASFFKDVGVKGIVFGSLLKNNEIDFYALDKMSKAAAGLPLTFHKAIDFTPDPLKSLMSLAREKIVSTVLTSGGPGSAWDNRLVLKEMVAFGKDNNVTVLVAGGVRFDNLPALHEFLNATAYHGRKIVPNIG
jgi:copper homeostasis protein